LVGEWLNTSEIIDKNAIKPCHRLGWCPYGKLVEEFPINQFFYFELAEVD
jgi:hypothetical protein